MITYNIALEFTSVKEENNIKLFLARYTEICNEASILLYGRKTYYIKEVHSLCYTKLRQQFPDMPAQAVIRAIREITASYKSIKSNKHKIDKPLIKRNHSIRLDERLYSNMTDKSIKLTNPFSRGRRILVNYVLYNKVIGLFNKYSVCDPLLFIRNNKIYLSVSFNTPELLPENNSVLGVDLGLRRLAVTSDGIAFIDKEYLKQKRKLRYLKRCLQSKGTKSANRKLKKIKNKERNVNKNFNHHLANAILDTDKSIIVLEDLKKIKENTKSQNNRKRTKHNNRMSQVSFYKLKSILAYKAPLLKKRVETVSAYMTSQDDCRALPRGTRKGCRYYTSDNKVFDADWNAAINIRNRYRKSPSPVLPLDGTLQRQAVYQPANRNLELKP